MMADAKVRTIIALDADGAPVGMFTLVDLLRRVVLSGRSLETPLADVMTAPLVTLPASATAAEGMHVMAARGVRQIAVVDNGRLAGVINERDLFALQRVSMRQVNEELHGATTIADLKEAGDDIRRLTQNLLAQGVGAEPLTRTIASLNDALSRRAIEIALLEHDLAGIDWCWLALGSEGRGEQTFATDQDNALLFAAGDEREAGGTARAAAGVRARGQCEPRPPRLPALPRQRHGEQSGSVPVDRGVEGQVPGLDPPADAAGVAQCEHRVRLPAALRQHDALHRAARLAVPVFDGESDVPATDGAERARRRSAARTDPHVRRRRRRPPSRARSTSRRAGRGSSSTARASSRWRMRSPTREPPRACARRASACKSRRGTSTRRSRHFISCSSCGCASRTRRRRAAIRTGSIRTR